MESCKSLPLVRQTANKLKASRSSSSFETKRYTILRCFASLLRPVARFSQRATLWRAVLKSKEGLAFGESTLELKADNSRHASSCDRRSSGTPSIQLKLHRLAACSKLRSSLELLYGQGNNCCTFPKLVRSPAGLHRRVVAIRR